MAKKKRKWTRNQKESAVLITLGVSVLICGACFLSPLKDAVKFGSKAIVKDLPIDDIKPCRASRSVVPPRPPPCPFSSARLQALIKLVCDDTAVVRVRLLRLPCVFL